MTPKHIRSFQIRNTRFHLTEREDGTLQITSVHPYDKADYHYAIQATQCRWCITRRGRIVTTITERFEISPEAIAYCLLRADLEAKLIPRRAVW